ncbi:TIM barrel protein [Dethiothermospora halolimnae]|uniref:TIM barrel protein n=1 Tax=Dethiothermospora halolimnae TaxID=3114390 RepID=UPI003CCBA2E9
MKDKLNYIHLIGGDGSSDTHMMLGEGIIPFKEFFHNAEEYNYDGYLTFELGSAYIHDLSLYINMAMDKIKGYLK